MRRPGIALRSFITCSVWAVAVALGVAWSATTSGVAWAQALAEDPRLVRGRLDSGVRYLVMDHPMPPGRVSAWLHINTGSLAETDQQRGIAHFLEHLAFNGSKHFPPGEVVPFFEKLGLTFGRHQNAMTGFADTRYTLSLPKNDLESLDSALLFLSDVAGGLTLEPAEIDAERQIILEEKRARTGPEQRIFERFLEELAPGSLLGARLPIGTEERITGVTRDDFVSFYRAWYRPANMTVLVVGDVRADVAVERIRSAFSLASGVFDPEVLGPRPAPVDGRVEPTTGRRALVLSDPELTRTTVSLVRVDRPRQPVRTVEDYRRDLVEMLASSAFNRRVSGMIAEGRLAAQSASAGTSTLFNVARMAQAEAAGEPAAWADTLTALATELQRARLHGFSAREIEDATRSMVAIAEAGVRSQQDIRSDSLLAMFAAKVGVDEPIPSPQQHLDLLRELLPTISADEVREAFARDYAFESAIFMVQCPQRSAPSEADVMRVATQAVDSTPPPLEQDDRPQSLLADPPQAGAIEGEPAVHDATGVTTFWLSNGVLVHHRAMADERDTVIVRATLAGGRIEETGSTHGLTEAAMLAWRRPATGRLSSVNVRDLLAGTTIRSQGIGPGDDALGVQVVASPQEVGQAFELLHAMLSDPRIEPAPFENWRTAVRQQIERRGVDPQARFSQAIFEAMYEQADARTRAVGIEQLDALTLGGTQAWLDRLVATAPMEVAIVGNLSLGDALELAERYVGSLPKRPRIDAATLAPQRTVPPPQRERELIVRVPTTTLQAIVVEGFQGPEFTDVPGNRRMEIGTQVLSTRMVARLREQMQLVYSVQCGLAPSPAYQGHGLVTAFAPSTEPSKALALADEIRRMFQEMADQGPTDEETRTAAVQLANIVVENENRPAFWAGRLAQVGYRGRNLEDFVNEPIAYQSITADEVRAAFAEHVGRGLWLRLIVEPEPSPASAPAPDPQPGRPRPEQP